MLVGALGRHLWINTLETEHNSRRFVDNIYIHIFLVL